MGSNNSYKIIKHIAVINSWNGGGITVEVNYVSKNGGRAILHLGRWDRNNNKSICGIFINKYELSQLLTVLKADMPTVIPYKVAKEKNE